MRQNILPGNIINVLAVVLVKYDTSISTLGDIFLRDSRSIVISEMRVKEILQADERDLWLTLGPLLHQGSIFRTLPTLNMTKL